MTAAAPGNGTNRAVSKRGIAILNQYWRTCREGDNLGSKSASNHQVQDSRFGKCRFLNLQLERPQANEWPPYRTSIYQFVLVPSKL